MSETITPEIAEKYGYQGVVAVNDAEKAQAKRMESQVLPSRAVPFAPFPMSWNVSKTNGSEGPLIVISVQTQMGDVYYFLNPPIAKQIGEAIIQVSDEVLFSTE